MKSASDQLLRRDVSSPYIAPDVLGCMFYVSRMIMDKSGPQTHPDCRISSHVYLHGARRHQGCHVRSGPARLEGCGLKVMDFQLATQ